MNQSFISAQDTAEQQQNPAFGGFQTSGAHLFQNAHEQYQSSQLSNPALPPPMVPGNYGASSNLYQHGVPQQLPSGTYTQQPQSAMGQTLPGIMAQGLSQFGQSAPIHQPILPPPTQQSNLMLPNTMGQFTSQPNVMGQSSNTMPIQFAQQGNPLSQLGQPQSHTSLANSGIGQSQFYDPRTAMGAPQTVQAVQFGADVSKGALPKLIAMAEAPGGNINLYEATKLVILMVTNPANMVISLPGIRRSDKTYDTPHGPKSGYVFYKNQADHIKLLDQLFPGSGWQDQLVEKAPEPTEKKTPELLWSGNINYSGRICTFYLYEYSDKSLAVFTPIDLSQVLVPFKLICPHGGGTSQPGYNAYKNKADHIKFIKSLIPTVDFEAMYKKSAPKVAGPSGPSGPSGGKVVRDPIRIFYHDFIWNGSNFSIEVVEYSESSIAVFNTPMFEIPGLQRTSNLKHPQQGPRDGMIIAKGNKSQLDILKNYIGKPDLESLFVMEPETSSTRGSMFGNSTLPSGSNDVASMVSDMRPRTYEDIPVDTLIRILRTKLEKMDVLEVKELIGGDVMLSGTEEQVNAQKELYIDAEISIEVNSGCRCISIVKLSVF